MWCLLSVYLNFFLTCLFSRGKRRSLSFGTMPPTNRQYARPCLHGSRSSSDLIWTHLHFYMQSVNDDLDTRSPFDCLTVSLPGISLHCRATAFYTEMKVTDSHWNHVVRTQWSFTQNKTYLTSSAMDTVQKIIHTGDLSFFFLFFFAHILSAACM